MFRLKYGMIQYKTDNNLNFWLVYITFCRHTIMNNLHTDYVTCLQLCKPKLKSLFKTSSRLETNEITVLKLELRCFEHYLLPILQYFPFNVCSRETIHSMKNSRKLDCRRQ